MATPSVQLQEAKFSFMQETAQRLLDNVTSITERYNDISDNGATVAPLEKCFTLTDTLVFDAEPVRTTPDLGSPYLANLTTATAGVLTQSSTKPEVSEAIKYFYGIRPADKFLQEAQQAADTAAAAANVGGAVTADGLRKSKLGVVVTNSSAVDSALSALIVGLPTAETVNTALIAYDTASSAYLDASGQYSSTVSQITNFRLANDLSGFAFGEAYAQAVAALVAADAAFTAAPTNLAKYDTLLNATAAVDNYFTIPGDLREEYGKLLERRDNRLAVYQGAATALAAAKNALDSNSELVATGILDKLKAFIPDSKKVVDAATQAAQSASETDITYLTGKVTEFISPLMTAIAPLLSAVAPINALATALDTLLTDLQTSVTDLGTTPASLVQAKYSAYAQVAKMYIFYYLEEAAKADLIAASVGNTSEAQNILNGVIQGKTLFEKFSAAGKAVNEVAKIEIDARIAKIVSVTALRKDMMPASSAIELSQLRAASKLIDIYAGLLTDPVTLESIDGDADALRIFTNANDTMMSDMITDTFTLPDSESATLATYNSLLFALEGRLSDACLENTKLAYSEPVFSYKKTLIDHMRIIAREVYSEFEFYVSPVLSKEAGFSILSNAIITNARNTNIFPNKTALSSILKSLSTSTIDPAGIYDIAIKVAQWITADNNTAYLPASADSLSTLYTDVSASFVRLKSDISGAVAPLATAAGLTTAVAPLATVAGLATAVAPLATSADLTSAVAPLATAAGLTSAVAPLATAAGLTSAVAPLATAAGLTSAVAPLATAAGLTSAVAPLATAAGLTSAVAPLATAAGLTSAVAPLATSAGLTTAVAPLATSAGLTTAKEEVLAGVTTAKDNVVLRVSDLSGSISTALAGVLTKVVDLSNGVTSVVSGAVTTLVGATTPLATKLDVSGAFDLLSTQLAALPSIILQQPLPMITPKTVPTEATAVAADATDIIQNTTTADDSLASLIRSIRTSLTAVTTAVGELKANQETIMNALRLRPPYR